MALERIARCYDLLLAQVGLGKTITYGEFAPQLGVAPIGIGAYLMPILNWCRASRHPELPIVVVSRRTRKPNGPYEDRMIAAETAKVFAFDWTKIERPSPWELHQPR
ncbi:MAG: hypothetical protein K2P80_12035 [Beijerinckiaceae bacterium]|nr:hypothetical protein [Beijerinckiaceae bacterium]